MGAMGAGYLMDDLRVATKLWGLLAAARTPAQPSLVVQLDRQALLIPQLVALGGGKSPALDQAQESLRQEETIDERMEASQELSVAAGASTSPTGLFLLRSHKRSDTTRQTHSAPVPQSLRSLPAA